MKTSSRILIATSVLLSAHLGLSPSALMAQAGAPAPYIRVGEELTFDVRSSRFGNMGTAVMRTVRDTSGGRAAYKLSFDFSARVLLFKVSDRTRSWIDTETLHTLRYTKSERSPIGSREEDVTVRAGIGSWTDTSGEHPLAAAAPLDELAFIYLVRSAASALDAGGIYVNRHFDVQRNSIKLTSRGAERVAALGDTLDARVIVMDAKDSRQKSGSSRIVFYIGRDDAHLPLRIVSSMPMAGQMTMTLRAVKAPQAVVAGK